MTWLSPQLDMTMPAEPKKGPCLEGAVCSASSGA